MRRTTAIVADFGAFNLYIGDDYRVDVSSEAGDRWDKNLTGFRAEDEIVQCRRLGPGRLRAANHDPDPVMSGGGHTGRATNPASE